MIAAGETSFLCIPDLLKATPREEDGKRFVYMEAANEAVDQQAERVLAKALADSADYFLRFGNLDIEHITQLGPARGTPDYPMFEIGRPIDVRVGRQDVMVKGQLAQGEARTARMANIFWDSITAQKPPQHWYPSVGGAVQDRGVEMDKKSRMPVKVIRSVRWTNIGFSKTPVNPTVPPVSTVPFGMLTKAWGIGGLDLAKALEAGYGTDMATLSGGAALRAESADKRIQSYWDFRDRLAEDIRQHRVATAPRALVAHAAATYGLPSDEAAEWVERFLADLRDGLQKKKGLH